MRKNMTKTVITTVISGVVITPTEDGTLESTDLEPIKIVGKISTERANKELRKAYKDLANIIVTKVEYEIKNYQMSIEQFIAMAEIINDEYADEMGDDE